VTERRQTSANWDRICYFNKKTNLEVTNRRLDKQKERSGIRDQHQKNWDRSVVQKKTNIEVTDRR
jgi:hypothetical protein